jgi:hypothetical protein
VSVTHAVDIDEIQTTRGEKALAFVLALFLLIGLAWAYVQLDTRAPYGPPPPLTIEERAAIEELAVAEKALRAAEQARDAALVDLDVRRERYRTALDAGRTAPLLEARYRRAEAAYIASREGVASARARVASLQPAADAAHKRQAGESEAQRRSDERLTFFLRLAFVLGLLGAAYGVLHALRGSRYYTLALAGVVAAALMVFGFAGDYTEDYVELRNHGPVVLAIAGILLTLGAFWSLQRYLRRRIPIRRLRKGECAFCGFPTAGNTSCEGCGRAVAGSCTECGERRRVGVRFCGSCGHA